MGNWYKNVTTRGPSQADVMAILARYTRRAYVTPTRDAVTVVFDERSEAEMQPTELGDLAFTLSSELRCPTLAAAVYDDDVLLLALYDAGRQVGEFNSAGVSTLHASDLARVFRVPERTFLLWLILESPRVPLFIFESFRHRLLLRALRHPLWALASGYRYIREGELPEDLTLEDLTHVDGLPSA